MAVNYSAAALAGRIDATIAVIKGQTLVAATGTATDAVLVIGTSALSGSTGVLATVPLPAAGITRSNNILNLVASAQQATAGAGGTAALAEVRTGGGTVVTSGLTVGGTAEGTATGKDIVLAASTISNGQTVTISSAAITGK